MKTTRNKIGVTAKMREIRDNLSIEIMDMTFEQEKEYVKNQLEALKSIRYNKQNASIKPAF